MGRSFEKSQNQQNKMNAQVDRNLHKKTKQKDISLKAQLKAWENRDFAEIYGGKGAWQIAVDEELRKINVRMDYSDLNDALGTKGTGAKEWVDSHYDKKVIPKEMARLIREKLHY